MPYVMVICWATITEDAAARAFAQVRFRAWARARVRIRVRMRVGIRVGVA